MTEDAVRLFFSYSHKDEAFRDMLATHLSNLEQRGIISSWHDRKLAAGMEWDDEIKSQLDSADIILLLISPDFMASKYCHEVEIPQALRRHEARDACVVPVILRSCDWSDAPFAKLQAFPKDAKPVARWDDKDEAFVSVTQGIRAAAKSLLDHRKQKFEQKESDIARYRQKVVEVLSDGDISIIERDTLDELRDKLGLTPEEVGEIEDEEFKPHSNRRENRENYKKTLVKLVEEGYYPFNEEIKKDLEDRQRDLGLKPEDAARIAKPILDRAELDYQANKQQLAKAEGLQELEREQKEYEAKLEHYRQEFSRAVQAEYPLNQQVAEGLRNFRQQLGLKNEDFDRVERSLRESAEAKYQEKLRQQVKVEPQRPVERVELETSPQTEQQRKQTFEFDIVTVNRKGEEISRARKTAELLTEDLGSGLLLEMVKIPSGTFQMGSPMGQGVASNNERPQHAVTVPAFSIGKFPITQAQWLAVTVLPKVKHDLDPKPANFQGSNRPVEQVSWYEAVEFCDRLSQKTGRTYRLPSEAEWEYACRAGTTTPFHFGEALPATLANFNSGNAVTFFTKALLNSTSDVGSFKVANDFGLYDMHGNVWEWCADHWHDNYQNAPLDGQSWVSEDDAQSRVLRGGSWDYASRDCRSASRIRYTPGFRLNVIGFRVVAV